MLGISVSSCYIRCIKVESLTTEQIKNQFSGGHLASSSALTVAKMEVFFSGSSLGCKVNGCTVPHHTIYEGDMLQHLR